MVDEAGAANAYHLVFIDSEKLYRLARLEIVVGEVFVGLERNGQYQMVKCVVFCVPNLYGVVYAGFVEASRNVVGRERVPIVFLLVGQFLA